jgi:hypothetical protein
MNEPIGERVIAKLSTHLGPHVARMALKSFAQKAGIQDQAQLTAAHLPGLVEEIRPMLNVMIGRGPGEALAADIARLVP